MEQEGVEIRLFEKTDEALVEEFYRQMGTETRAFFNPSGYNYNRSMRFFREEPQKGILHWMAVSEGKMAGYIFLWDVRDGVVWMGIAVAEAFKGRKLGEKLIRHAQDWCREHNKGGIMLTTHPANIRAQLLYRKCGFQFMGVSDNRGEYLYLYNITGDKNDEN